MILVDSRETLSHIFTRGCIQSNPIYIFSYLQTPFQRRIDHPSSTLPGQILGREEP